VTFIEPWSPYSGHEQILSAGRRTLVTAFVDLVRCQAGFQRYELAEIFAAPADEGENDACRHLVQMDADFLSEQFLTGRIATFARPLGGGGSLAIPAGLWEIDNPLVRFATGAFNFEYWADANAPVTHRIFVDMQQFDQWLAALRPPDMLTDRQLEEALNPRLRSARLTAARQVKASRLEPQTPPMDGVSMASLTQIPTGVLELLKIAEVEALVRFKRQTIYTKIKTDGFPEPIKLGAMSRWDKMAVLAWLEEQIALGGNKDG
jgi:predicted DNA-binding transcriptional regulator AlpA